MSTFRISNSLQKELMRIRLRSQFPRFFQVPPKATVGEAHQLWWDSGPKEDMQYMFHSRDFRQKL